MITTWEYFELLYQFVQCMLSSSKLDHDPVFFAHTHILEFDKKLLLTCTESYLWFPGEADVLDPFKGCVSIVTCSMNAYSNRLFLL